MIDGQPVPSSPGDPEKLCWIARCGSHTITVMVSNCFDGTRFVGDFSCSTTITVHFPPPTLTVLGTSSPCLCGGGSWVDVRVDRDPCLGGFILDNFSGGGGIVTNLGGNTYHVVFPGDGDYDLSASLSNYPCNSQTTKTFTVGAPHRPTITGPTDACADELLAFDGSVDGPCPPASWNWTVTPMTSTTTIINDGMGGVEVRSPVSYTLCLTVTNECGQTSPQQCWQLRVGSLCHGQKVSGGEGMPIAANPISKSVFEKSFSISPNPSPGSFRLTLPEAGGVTDVSVVDVGGKIARTLAPVTEQTVSMDGWPDGNYFVVIRTRDYTIVRSVTIAR